MIEMPKGLSSPSRVLASLNGQHHIVDTETHQVKSYGFFVHEAGATISSLELDPKFNTGSLTWLDGAALTGPAEYIIPGIRAITLTSGGVSLFKEQ